MNIWGLAIIALAFILILAFSFVKRKKAQQTFREIGAFTALKKSVDLSVEEGTRLHITLGSGGIFGPQASAVFVGLSLLRQVARIAANSDQAPIATNGDGLQNILAHDVLRRTYQEMDIANEYHYRLARVTGLTPFSYGAGAMQLILDNVAAPSVLLGSFSEEAGLITAATQRQSSHSFGASDNLVGQSIVYASTDHPLIGEELYAAGAYLNAGPIHIASLQVQDILRWILILSITLIALAHLMGAFF